MRRVEWFVVVLAVGLVFGADGVFAKGKGGGKKNKHKADEPALEIGKAMTITGTIKADGDNVKLIAEDKTEYMLAISTALANKEKNGQKVTITGTVTEIAGKKWLSADAQAENKDVKPADNKAAKKAEK